MSGWCGDNVAERSIRMDWYTGPTLLEALDTLKLPPKNLDSEPLRLAV